jgi:GDP-4-dehydro-6-deoxy-D-mannose reductase
VCSGQGRSIQEALDRLRQMSTKDVEVKVDSARLRKIDVPAFCGSYEKIKQAVGWEPERSFDELLADLLEYWRGQVGAESVA